MANQIIRRDDNRITVLAGVTDDANQEIRNLLIDPTTGRLKVSAVVSASLATLSDVNITNVQNGEVLSYNTATQKWINSSAGAGSVTTVSVVSANGFAGTVANASSTPAITLTTSITGLLKGNGTAISSATAADVPVTSRTVGNSVVLDTALGNLDSALSLLNMNGFSSWTSGSDASTYSIGGGNFTVVRSGQGFINSKLITWTANQTIALASISANTTGWVYVDGTGTVTWGTSAATVYAAIPLFFVWYDGTNYFVEKENHYYNFESKLSSYLHNTINVVVRGVGCLLSRVATGTGASADDRRLKLTGADTVDDHGLSTAVAATNPITLITVYLSAGGKWLQYHTQSEITPFYNNAGTPTALDATPNKYCVYTIYALQDDINSSDPRFIAVMDDAAYATLVDAEAAITAGTVSYATNEIKTIEPCQLGYAILEYTATGGDIAEVIIARNTFNQALIGGGAAGGSNHALLTNLDFASAGHTGFTAPATTDTFTNKTYDTAGTGNVFKINGTAISDKTGTGKVVLDTAPQISTIELGHASDTTISRASAGVAAVEGNNIVVNTSSPTLATITTTGNIELGHASDTTIARVSAGVVSIEGVNIVTESSTNTLTNKTLGTTQLGEVSLKLDAALSADGTWSGITETGTAGATLTFGQLCYFQASDSRWELADANLSAGYDKKLGMCVLAAAGDGSATEMLLIGKIRADAAFPTLTIGSPVYMSETAGAIVVAQPTTADVCIRVIGYANTADELYFNPSSDYTTHT